MKLKQVKLRVNLTRKLFLLACKIHLYFYSLGFMGLAANQSLKKITDYFAQDLFFDRRRDEIENKIFSSYLKNQKKNSRSVKIYFLKNFFCFRCRDKKWKINILIGKQLKTRNNGTGGRREWPFAGTGRTETESIFFLLLFGVRRIPPTIFYFFHNPPSHNLHLV